MKNGLTWGGSGEYFGYNYPYFGCFAFAGHGKAFFGIGGSETEKVEDLMAQRPGKGGGGMHPLRISSLDTDCLLLSNQAKLDAKLDSVLNALVADQVLPNPYFGFNPEGRTSKGKGKGNGFYSSEGYYYYSYGHGPTRQG